MYSTVLHVLYLLNPVTVVERDILCSFVWSGDLWSVVNISEIRLGGTFLARMFIYAVLM